MEKVWAELKKIEAQATQIKIEAQAKNKEIVVVAQQEAETLSANSKNYAKEEAQNLYETAVKDASKNRESQLKANQEQTQKLSAQAQKNMPKAAEAIVKRVLGESEA
jgi:vacuolar-type H+-ATPase subunit H